MLSRLVFLAPIFLAACASPSQNSFYEDRGIEKAIVGNWECDFEHSFPEGSLGFETKDSYVANGRYTSFGSFIMYLEEEDVELEYVLADSGTWEVLDGKFVSTSEDFRIKNVSHPGIEEFFDINEVFPKNMSGSATILELSEEKMVLKIDRNTPEMNCIRIDA
ncbi:hypothetical protein [Marinobacter nauticus]|uniref:hypothetical protein n=1 Tax=Marinobacter nauticus TaxID=2743 RepID=UPI001C559C1C|nr:hypothetical protein [Marinobacter nauticus]MBW3198129.1 hypothetical protein [Marinobacter nauticus]MBY6183539.1 hypothetical protein [Marinobacter nauticus]